MVASPSFSSDSLLKYAGLGWEESAWNVHVKFPV